MLVWQAHKSKVRSLVFSPDGTRIATVADKPKAICVWHAPTGQLVKKLVNPVAAVQAIAYFPDGRHLAAHPKGMSIQVWDVEAVRVVAAHHNQVYHSEDLAVSPDGSRLFANSQDDIAEWIEPTRAGESAREPDHRHELGHRGVARIGFSRTGKYFCVAGWFMHLHTPDLKKELRQLRDPTSGDSLGASVNRFAFNTDDSRLVLGLGQRAVVWSPGDLEASPVLIAGHGKKVMGVGFLPGNQVLTAGMDGTARIWDQNTGAEVRSFDWGIGKVSAAAVSPDGTLCAAGSTDGRLIVWDVDS